MKRTFCTVIRDKDVEAALGPMAEALAPARHWAFREIHINKRPLKDVKREALKKFGITARHFNGIRFELTQAVNIWAGGLKYRRDSLRERIKDLTKQISGIQKKLADPKKELSRRKRRQLRFSLHQKKRHLGIQKLHGTLDCPARNSPRHVWRRWRGVRRRPRGRVPTHPPAPRGRRLDTNGTGRAKARASAAEGLPRYGKSSHGGRTRSVQPPARDAVVRAVTTSAVTADT